MALPVVFGRIRGLPIVGGNVVMDPKRTIGFQHVFSYFTFSACLLFVLSALILEYARQYAWTNLSPFGGLELNVVNKNPDSPERYTGNHGMTPASNPSATTFPSMCPLLTSAWI